MTFGFTFGIEIPKKRENPKMKTFLEEFRSMYCRFESPTPAIIPKSMKKSALIIGDGSVIKKAPNFEKSPRKTKMKPQL